MSSSAVPTFNISLFYIISEIFDLIPTVLTNLEPIVEASPQNSGQILIIKNKIQIAVKNVLENLRS